QEIFTLAISQTYFSNATASTVDRNSATGYTTTAPNNFSPIGIRARVMPVVYLTGDFTAEIDSHYRQLRAVNLNGVHSWSQHGSTSIGWSRRFFIAELPGFNDPLLLGNNIYANTNIHTR